MIDLLKFNKPEQFPKDEILNEKDRLVRSWMSVEVTDKQGDIVPIDQLKKVLNTWFKRGATMIDQHTNRPIGKGLRWQESIHPESKKPGIILDYQVFDDYSVDDQVWNDIKSGKRTGLSIGGRATGVPQMKEDDYTGNMGKYLQGLELYEVSPVDSPANQLGTNIAVNYLAKGMDENSEQNKEFAKRLIDFYESLNDNSDKVAEGSQGDYQYKSYFCDEQQHQTLIDNIHKSIQGNDSGQPISQYYDKSPILSEISKKDSLTKDKHSHSFSSRIYDFAKEGAQRHSCNICKLILHDCRDDVQSHDVFCDIQKAISLNKKQNKIGDLASHQKDTSESLSYKKHNLSLSSQYSQTDLSDSFALFKDMHDYYLKVMQKAKDILKPMGTFKDFADCVVAQKDKGHSDDSAKRICGFIMHQTEKKFLEGANIPKMEKAREVGGFESPEPGDLPEAGAKLLASVYAKYRKEGMGKAEAAQRAWGAVENAGYKSKAKDQIGAIDRDELEGFLSTHPNPKDEDVHTWAEEKGYDKDKVEEAIYRIATAQKQKKNTLPGGLADNADASQFDPEQLAMGVKVEMEHTNDPKIARELAMDHLSEDPKYYSKLREMENKQEPGTTDLPGTVDDIKELAGFKHILHAGDDKQYYDLYFANDEFYIFDEGVGVWRSSDYYPEEAKAKWQELTGEKAEFGDEVSKQLREQEQRMRQARFRQRDGTGPRAQTGDCDLQKKRVYLQPGQKAPQGVKVQQEKKPEQKPSQEEDIGPREMAQEDTRDLIDEFARDGQFHAGKEIASMISDSLSIDLDEASEIVEEEYKNVKQEADKIMDIDNKIWSKHGWRSAGDVKPEIYANEVKQALEQAGLSGKKIRNSVWRLVEDENFHSILEVMNNLKMLKKDNLKKYEGKLSEVRKRLWPTALIKSLSMPKKSVETWPADFTKACIKPKTLNR